MILNREDLLKKLELKKETVTLDDGEVIVSELGASDLMDLYTRKELHNEAGDIIMAKFTPALVALAVVDESGARIFMDADIPLLEKASATQFAKISAAARRLSGLAGDEEKN
jgi:hypothetical protein